MKEFTRITSIDALSFIRKWSTGPWEDLTNVIRYSTLPVIHRESVAEHSYFVAVYAYAIGSLLRNQGCEIDMETLLTSALLHDLDEAVLGDVIRPVKYKYPTLRGELKHAAREEMDRVDKEYSFDNGEMLNRWYNAKLHDVIEGDIIHLVDGWSCVTYCEREINLGNRFAVKVLERDIRYFLNDHPWNPKLQPLVEALLSYVNNLVEGEPSVNF